MMKSEQIDNRFHTIHVTHIAKRICIQLVILCETRHLFGDLLLANDVFMHNLILADFHNIIRS